jgi:DNA polymerase-3 subunit delta
MGNLSLKYQNLLAFEKHLQQAAKVSLYPNNSESWHLGRAKTPGIDDCKRVNSHMDPFAIVDSRGFSRGPNANSLGCLGMSRVFLVVSPCAYERKKIVEKILSAIRTQQSDIYLHTEDAVQGLLEEQIAGLNTLSLLGGEQVLYLDNIDKLKKNGLAILAEYTAHPSPFAYLLLGANFSKNLGDLYSKGKKELIVCDLSDEKPWDRKERIKRALVDGAAKLGKRLNGDAVEYLLESIGLNLPGLEQEVAKLITYAGERSALTLQDVHVLCRVQKSATLWQLAEAVVWKESLPRIDESIDLSMVLSLISQLRLQLQQGLILAVLTERRAAQGEIAHYLPTVKPVALEKMLLIVKQRKSIFFKRALNLLFDVELIAKNSSLEPGIILDLVLAIRHTQMGSKENHVVSIS